MERGFADADAVAVLQRSRLARAELDGVVDDRPVDASQVFDKEGVALPPDARVAARDFGLGVEAREIDVGEDVRLRVGAPDELLSFWSWKVPASISVVPAMMSLAVARAARTLALAAAMGWRAPQCAQKTSSAAMVLPQKPQ